MLLSTQSFSGVAPRFAPHMLAPNQAQAALNTRLWSRILEPLPGGASVSTIVGRSGVKKTLYRMGQSAPSDTQYWLSWLADVDVCRSPLAGETSERTYYTGDGLPKFTDTALATGGTPYPLSSYDLGVPAPTGAATATVTGTADADTVIETRAYVYTNVRNYSGFAEESAPSPVVLADVYPGQTVTLSLMTAAPAGAHNITHRRIYRTASGSQGTNYYYVGEQSTASTTYADTVGAADLGEVLPSLTWDTPPATLKGLTAMAGGILAGFVTSFSTAAVELSATLMLVQSNSDAPLAYGLYVFMQSAAGRGPGAALGVIAVLLVAICTLAAHLLAERNQRIKGEAA